MSEKTAAIRSWGSASLHGAGGDGRPRASSSLLRTPPRRRLPGLSGAGSSLRGIPREVYVLAGMAAIVAVGFGIVAPAIPLLAKYFGVPHAVAGLAISAFALSRFASAFAHGKLVETLGERPVLIFGLFLQSAMMVIAGFAANYWMVIGARAVAGIGSAAFTVSAMSLVLRLAPAALRGRAASLYQGGFMVGSVAGPAVGGAITEINPRLPFTIYGAFLALAGLVVIGLLPRRISDSAPEEGEPDEPGECDGSLRRPDASAGSAEDGDGEQPHPLGLRSRAFLAACVINLASGWTLWGVRSALVPSYVVDVLGRSAAWMGVIFLIASLAQVAALVKAGQWSDSWGRKPTMLIGAVCAWCSAAVLLAPASAALFVLSMTSMGVASAFLSSAPAAVVGDVSAGRSGGRGIALFSMASDFGGVVGPLLAGVLADRYGYGAAFGSCALICAVAVLAALAMQETLVRPGAAARPAEAAALAA
ncbi:MAG: MFS transporter [Frankiaceae bacterium]|nr:MFS transporter [Frankiaceae bacterium]